VSRILAGNQVNRPQHRNRALGHITEIADGRRDNVQPGDEYFGLRVTFGRRLAHLILLPANRHLNAKNAKRTRSISVRTQLSDFAPWQLTPMSILGLLQVKELNLGGVGIKYRDR
jgi:hypothetical protein